MYRIGILTETAGRGCAHFSVHSPVLYDYRVKSSSQNVYASMRKMRKSRKTSLMEFTPFVANLQIFRTVSVLFMIQ